MADIADGVFSVCLYQGSVLTGVWVIAHECGHQSFSPYEWANNLVGTLGGLSLNPHSQPHSHITSTIVEKNLLRPLTCSLSLSVCVTAVGWVLHSALLVPYHSWRISHGKHHNNTGSCEHDEVFAPPHKEDLASEILLHSPLFNLFQIVVMLTIGTTSPGRPQSQIPLRHIDDKTNIGRTCPAIHRPLVRLWLMRRALTITIMPLVLSCVV